CIVAAFEHFWHFIGAAPGALANAEGQQFILTRGGTLSSNRKSVPCPALQPENCLALTADPPVPSAPDGRADAASGPPATAGCRRSLGVRPGFVRAAPDPRLAHSPIIRPRPPLGTTPERPTGHLWPAPAPPVPRCPRGRGWTRVRSRLLLRPQLRRR